MCIKQLQRQIPLSPGKTASRLTIFLNRLFIWDYGDKTKMGRFMGNEPPRIEESVKG
jgi:hypothetical protein